MLSIVSFSRILRLKELILGDFHKIKNVILSDTYLLQEIRRIDIKCYCVDSILAFYSIGWEM